ncbi:hypothetical protein [Nocardia aurantia]|uniref:Uncharacterized protein n=1 Tax=Nocardia aurantia TaxID=2585199 RepID=A0A7K0DW52_9NOCA|nr:hypothetical protein [Nocardia aurantia]MQY30010.1 hypothetical protein [Nocardia aurantia]
MTIRDFFRPLSVAQDAPVYGTPVETADGSTIITVASPGGWLRPGMRPIGVFVVHGGQVTWSAAEDNTRIALLGETIGLLSAVIATLAVLRRPPWPDLALRRDGSVGPR